MKHLQNWPAGFNTKLVAVIQGDFQVSSDPAVALSTILGSCASVCLFDPDSGLGGMNHYLLADSAQSGSVSLKYGAHAMELLINSLLKMGAARHRLKAKVFGGGLITGRFDYIGPRNTKFALQYLEDEGIPVISQDIGGNAARRLNFHPPTGQVRITYTQTKTDPAMSHPPKPAAPTKPTTNPILF